MLTIIGVIAIVLICVWTFWYTLKLGKEQLKDENPKYDTKKSYTSLSYIYGIIFLITILVLIGFVVYMI